MFDKIVLRRSEEGLAISIGELAQAMFFYKHIHIVFDRITTSQLVKDIGTEGVLSLLSRDNVTAVYVEDELSLQHISTTYKHFSFSSIIVIGEPSGQIFKTCQERLAYEITRLSGIDKNSAQSFAIKFFIQVRHRTYTSDFFVKAGILKAAQSDVMDISLLHESTRRTLANLLGTNEVGAYKIEATPTPQGFRITTDIDFDKVNHEYKALGKPDEVKLENILLQLLIAKSDELLAAFYDGDIYTSPLSSQIISIRHQEIIKKITGNTEAVTMFEEVALPNAAPIKEIINSKQKTFDEFLTLLDKAEKFRTWAHGLESDKKLALEYMKEVNARGWSEHSMVKALRFLVCTGVGLVEPFSGTALSYADTFLLDKLTKGWRPNQFIDKELAPFTSKPI